MKFCKTCNIEKPITEFHKDKSKSDGLNSYCKPCQIARQKNYGLRPPRHKDPEGMKRCQRCKETKPTSEFYALSTTYDGLQKRCKTCSGILHNHWRRNNLEHAAANQMKHRKAHPERFRDYHRKKLYGLKPGEYAKILSAQNGGCAICKTTVAGRNGQSFHVDHCHNTNVIRGLLCHGCNVSIGHFKHDPQLLRAAANYVESFITQT